MPVSRPESSVNEPLNPDRGFAPFRARPGTLAFPARNVTDAGQEIGWRTEAAMGRIDEKALARAYNRALKLEKAGDRAGAAESYREALALDPRDPGGVAVRLAALGMGDTPVRAPELYVATLFDQHADRFDTILVDRLGYSVPMQIRQMLIDRDAGPVGRALDLGCGTGLCGAAFGKRCRRLIGVDLSEEMVAAAHDRGVYDALYVADAIRFLEESDEPDWDLIVAADMLPYLGDLLALFDGFAARLRPGGSVAFSTETLPDEAFADAPYRVGPKHRFAHSESYTRDLMAERGFEIERFDPITVRKEEGDPVPGHLVFATRS